MSELKLNLGCGGNILKGFENHDSDLDISKRLPYADNSVSYVFCEHCVEHITHIEALGFFRECLRILKPGGTLRVCIPVLESLNREHAADIICGHGHKAAYTCDLIKHMLRVAGFGWQNIERTARADTDGHWKVIGDEKDMLETCRIEATK